MLSGWAYLIVGWLASLAMVPVVTRQHRRPYVAIAWLGCIFAIPPLAIPLYFVFSVFGVRRHRATEVAVRRAYEDELHDRAPTGTIAALEPGVAQDLARIALNVHRRAGNVQPLFTGNDITLLADGDFVDRLCDDIARAREHVHMLFFIVAPDDTGRRVARALADAAGRGVTCRLLVDAFGSSDFLDDIAPSLRRDGVAVLPILEMRPLTRPLRRFDVRNHRKNAVIDGRVGYTGSANIHDPDFELEDRAGEWHQITARVDGPVVLSLQRLFLEGWAFATGDRLSDEALFPHRDDAAGRPAQLIADGPSYPGNAIRHTYVQAIAAARSSALLVSPYFVPDESLIVALCSAALRGVEVTILLPRSSDRPVADLASRSFWSTLLEAGVRIREHDRGVLHVKAAVIDAAVAMLGTANLDRRSFFLNYEMMLLLPDRDVALRLGRMLRPHLDASTEVSPADWRERPTAQRWKQDFAGLLSPVL